jgi:hypothetical protein
MLPTNQGLDGSGISTRHTPEELQEALELKATGISVHAANSGMFPNDTDHPLRSRFLAVT